VEVELWAALSSAGERSSQTLAGGREVGVEGYSTKSSCRLLFLLVEFEFGG
jgi:hypothetical protein